MQIIQFWLEPEEARLSYNEMVISDDLVGVPQYGTSPSVLSLRVQQIIANNVKNTALPQPWLGWWFGENSDKYPEASFGDTHLFGYRHRVKTPDFKERCAAGEILMNDYNVCRGTLTYGDKERRKTVIAPYISHWYTPSISNLFPFEANKWYKIWTYGYYEGRNGSCVYVDGAWRKHLNSLFEDQYPVYVESFEVGRPADPRVNLKRTGDLLQEPANEIEHVTVQEVLAKANGGDLDALTAVAEMPKLVESIIAGFKLIKKIFLDAKKREFRIWATVPSRTRRLASEAHAKYKAKALRKIPSQKRWLRSNPGLTPADYQLYRALRLQRIVDLETFLKNKDGVYRKRATREIAEALSNVHLNVMYNIKPAIYTIQDSLAAMDNYESSYRRYGNGNTPVVTDIKHLITLAGVPEAVFEGSAYTEFRCLIKRRYSNKDITDKINKTMTGDVLVTGFELIKLWSIVFDWFFTISDALRAIPWNKAYVQQASCVSWKTVIDGKFTWDYEGDNHTVEVQMEHFRRSLYNPVHSIGIYFRDNFGFLQQLSALAFAFGHVNGTLKRRYTF